MKKLTIVFLLVVALAVGVLIAAFTIYSGYSEAATWLIGAPTIGMVITASLTVFSYGRLELQREAAAAFLSYAVLGFLTGAAYFIGEPAVLEKFVDAFLFGQVIALLSVTKACLQAWNDPVAPEDQVQRAARHAAAARVRRASFRSAPHKR